MNNIRRRTRGTLLLQAIAFMSILMGVLILISGALSRSVNMGDLLFTIGIAVIILGSILVIISMIRHIVFGKKWKNRLNSTFGLIGVFLGLLILSILWLLTIMTGGYKPIVGYVLFSLVLAFIVLSAGLPFIKLGGHRYQVIAGSIFLLLFLAGSLKEIVPLVILSFIAPLTVYIIGCFMIREKIERDIPSN